MATTSFQGRNIWRESLSPYYSTGKERKLEQDYTSKLQTVKQQYQNELREISRAKEQELNRVKANSDIINNECSRLKKENNDLQSKLARSSDTIEQQKASIATLKNQLEQLKTNRDIIDKLNTLEAPILELAKILSRDRAILPIREPKVSVLKKIKSFLKTTIPFLNLFFFHTHFICNADRTHEKQHHSKNLHKAGSDSKRRRCEKIFEQKFYSQRRYSSFKRN